MRHRSHRHPLDPTIPIGVRTLWKEADWQRVWTKAAREAGWLVVHFPNSAAKHANAELEDFPDVIALRRPRPPLVIEFKIKGNLATPGQIEWLEQWRGCGAEVHLFTFPRDWDAALEVLA